MQHYQHASVWINIIFDMLGRKKMDACDPNTYFILGDMQTFFFIPFFLFNELLIFLNGGNYQK